MKLLLAILLMFVIEAFCEFARPEITASTAIIYRTHTRHLRIAGTNFPPPEQYKMTLTFEPELIEGVGYTMNVVSTTELDVTLLAGHAWRAEPGKLMVTSITIDDTDGGFQIYPRASDDWLVGEVVAETDANEFLQDGLGIVPDLRASKAPVPQSSLPQFIIIRGAGFTSDLSLVLDPPLEVNVDYTLTVTSDSSAALQLLPGKKWRDTPGSLVARSIKCGGYELALDKVPIAVIIPPPASDVDQTYSSPKFDDADSDEEIFDDDDDFFDTDDVQWRATRDKMFENWEASFHVPSFKYFSPQKLRRALQSIDGSVFSDFKVLDLLTARYLRPRLAVMSSVALLLALYRFKNIGKRQLGEGAGHTHTNVCMV